MDDVVGRLLRELPDTDKNRYDIAYRRGRAQARSALLFGGLSLGLAVGAASTLLLDPGQGRSRRAELRQRLAARVNDLRRALEARREDIGNRAFGKAAELGLPGTPPTNAERRALKATSTVRTPPRSAVAARATVATSPHRQPVGAGAVDR